MRVGGDLNTLHRVSFVLSWRNVLLKKGQGSIKEYFHGFAIRLFNDMFNQRRIYSENYNVGRISRKWKDKFENSINRTMQSFISACSWEKYIQDICISYMLRQEIQIC